MGAISTKNERAENVVVLILKTGWLMCFAVFTVTVG